MRGALSCEERLAIFDRRTAGERLTDIASELGIHYETARKWWRIGRKQGRAAVVCPPRKPRRPPLQRVAPRVLLRLLELRDRHRGSWGVPYLRRKLLEDPGLSEEERATIPSVSAIYRYLHDIEEEPFPRRRLKNDTPTAPLIAQARHPHHVWQVDLKEKCRVDGLPSQVTVLTGRDVYSSAVVASEVFELRRDNSSLTGADVQEACRKSFERWGRPRVLRTDRGSCFVGTMPQSGFPSYFTLWLVGLGIEHELIGKGKVTQNGCVERYNRTYSSLVLRDGPFASMDELRRLSEVTVDFLNRSYPSRAGSCNGRPPLEAHPEALVPDRPYGRDQEAATFSLERVDQYLARFRWQRHTDRNGKLQMAAVAYHLGRDHPRTVFDVTFDPADRAFVFTTPDGTVSLRRPALGLQADDCLSISESRLRRLSPGEKRPPI